MLLLRANTGTNWPPPPPFFLSISLRSISSPGVFVLLHSCSMAAPSFWTITIFPFYIFTALPISLFSFRPSVFPLMFSHPLLPFALPHQLPTLLSSFFPLLCVWCSAGEPWGREIIQSLCILQALWSAAEPRCTDTLVYLVWPSKQPTPWQTAWMLLLHARTHTHAPGICRTHTLLLSVGRGACAPAEQTALKKFPTKKRREKNKWKRQGREGV